jgi:hypothetical protein
LSNNNFSKNVKIQTQYLYNYTPFQKIKAHKLFHQNYFFKTFIHIKKTDNINLLSNACLLVRPILNLHRFDLKKLLIFWKLPVYPDISNKQTHYHRNRIRKQLLPMLRFFFNPQIDIIMLQFAEILMTEQKYLDVVTNRLKYDFQLKNKKIVQLNSSLFYGIPLAIQRKLVKKFLESYSRKQVYFLQIEFILQGIIRKKKFTFSPFFVKLKRFKHHSFFPVKFNFTRPNVYELYWMTYKNKSKKKISLLNVYLSNKCLYTCFLSTKYLFSKHIHFFKKQFFLFSVNKFFHDLYIYSARILQAGTSCLPKGQVESKADFSIHLIFYFCIKQENKQNLQLFRSLIKKKNSFNFIKLANKHIIKKNKAEFSSEATLRVGTKCLPKGSIKLFCNKFATSTASHKEILNLFLHAYCFQKFEIFFYPEIGILFYFQKKLVFLNN